MTHTSTEQAEMLRLAAMYDYGDPLAHGNQWKVAVCTELRRLHARVQELEAEKARLIEAYVPCPSATEAYMYGITQEKQG